MDQVFLTTGQLSKKLRISVSTLKRWLLESDLSVSVFHNHNGWRLFTESDLEIIREYKRDLRKKGRRFNDTTLIPVTGNQKAQQ
jgi:DNA-binding transcriptional MerR regulator